MYRCYDTLDGMKSQQMALEFASLSVAGLVCCLAGGILLPKISQRAIYLALALIPALSCYFSIKGYLLYSRRYLVTDAGLVVKYTFLPEILYPWGTVREIGICKIHYAPRGCHYLTAIRCVIGEEQNGPHGGYGSWAGEFYSMRHLHNVIVIVYADYKLDEIKKYCPDKIKDYRWIKRFPHDPE